MLLDMLLQLLEEEEVEVPVVKESTKEATKMETDDAAPESAPSGSGDADVNMQDFKGTGDAPGVENGVPESGDKPVQMETDVKVSVGRGYAFHARFHAVFLVVNIHFAMVTYFLLFSVMVVVQHETKLTCQKLAACTRNLIFS